MALAKTKGAAVGPIVVSTGLSEVNLVFPRGTGEAFEMRPFRAAFWLLAPALLASAAEPVPVDLLPPGTKILVGLSLPALVNSPLIKSLGADSRKMSATFTSAAPLTNIDPLNDLDSIIFASGGQEDNAPQLVVLRGRFHPELKKSLRTHNGIALYVDSHGKDEVMALLDGNTAILGTMAQVKAAIDRHGKAAAAPAFTQRFEEMSGSFDFWGVGDVPEGFHSTDPSSKSLNSVDRFEFGVSLRQGLELMAKVHARSPQDMAQMAMSLKMIEAMLKAQPSMGSSKFDVQSDSSGLELSILVPEAELKSAIATQGDKLAAAFQSGLAAGFGATGNRTMAASSSSPRSFVPQPESTPAAAPAPAPAPKRPMSPPGVVKNSQGDTIKLTLPGGR